MSQDPDVRAKAYLVSNKIPWDLATELTFDEKVSFAKKSHCSNSGQQFRVVHDETDPLTWQRHSLEVLRRHHRRTKARTQCPKPILSRGST
jgi:hypothetical protein